MRRHYVILLVLVVLPFGGLLAANLFDYARFHVAIRRVERLTEAERITLADYCRKVDKHYRFDERNTPSAFLPLKPINGSLYPGSSDALLYELGGVYLWARIHTSAKNQQIFYFTNSSGRQRTKIIWNRNPEHVRELNPTGRIVTVSVWNMSEGFKWVVVPDRILVIGSPGTVGRDDEILASVPLSATALATVKSAMGDITPSMRGMHYTSGALDGTELRINFSSSGENGSQDIVVANTWTDTVGPLLNAISASGPKDHPITFERTIKEWHADDPKLPPPIVTPLAEWESNHYQEPRATPWWCVWRQFHP